MQQFIFNTLNKFAKFLIPKLRAQAIQFFRSAQGIQFRYLLSDFFAVLRSVGLFFFLQLFGFILFVMVGQGRDILLVAAEDLNHGKAMNTFFLLLGICFWSIAAEFASRYAIYVSDNSAKSLSDNRVRYRQALQKAFAAFFLMFPFITVGIGLTIVYFQDVGFGFTASKWGYYVIAAFLFFIFNFITHKYFDRNGREKKRETRENSFLNKLFLLPKRELKWCNKLYGIYNDYVFALPKAENFKGRPQKEMKDFIDFVVDDTITQKYNFPQSIQYMDTEKRVPQQFRLIKFTEEPGNDGQYRWIYLIPVSFYNALHRQLRTLFFIALVLFIAIICLPVNSYTVIGSPALVVISFGCWSCFYVGVLYIDYAKWRNFFLSLRFALLVLFIFSSVVNNDHPLRSYGSSSGNVYNKRPDLSSHFEQWMANYKKDPAHKFYYKSFDSLPDSSKYFYPVIFVCAEGGALRSGGFTSEMLSKIQDEMRKDSSNHFFDFNKSIYAYSGVSGGSLGVGFFNAINNLTGSENFKDSDDVHLTESFFRTDHLSPLIGKMFYGEIINLFLPFHIDAFDRAEALEESWEIGYDNLLKKGEQNIFATNNFQAYANKTNYPAMFINTTEVETGYQCVLSNVKPDSIHKAAERDLFNYKLNQNIHYSTMLNFSSRFPLFSPAAMLKPYEDASQKLHYVDGGYVENTGCGTMLEILRQLKDCKSFESIKPFVFILREADVDTNISTTSMKNINLFNEITEIGAGIYNTRIARTETAVDDMIKFINKANGVVIQLSLQRTGNQVPINWVLSEKSMDSIRTDVNLKWESRFNKNNDLHKLFLLDTSYKQHR